MSVVDSKALCKSIGEDLSGVEGSLQSIRDQLAAVLESVQLAAKAADSFDSVERTVQKSVLQLGKQLMDLFVQLQGDGDIGEQITTSQGQRLHRSSSTASTTIRSIFGVHRFEQFTYSAGKGKAIALRPISARMSLPARQWSYLLQELTQMLAVDSAYELALENLGKVLGGSFSVDTAESINEQMGQAAGEFFQDLPRPEPGSEGKLLIASADCKGVPLVKKDAPKVAAFETAKKNPGNRRMATVASVYTVDPHVRTAEEITAALFQEEVDQAQVKAKRPKPVNKNTTAHFPQIESDKGDNDFPISGIHVAVAWIMSQVKLRRAAGQVLIVLMDGQKSLWDTFALYLSFSARTIPILDILHALSYVWKAAALFEKDDVKRKAFTRVRLLRILRGEVRAVIRGLRSMGTTAELRGKAAEELNQICNYLETNADRMRYDEYLRRGYPIASGVIEGACRHLVKDRMERSGMRWTLEGARSMLNVRAAFQSDHWETFLKQRITREVNQTHPNQDLLANYHSLALAC